MFLGRKNVRQSTKSRNKTSVFCWKTVPFLIYTLSNHRSTQRELERILFTTTELTNRHISRDIRGRLLERQEPSVLAADSKHSIINNSSRDAKQRMKSIKRHSTRQEQNIMDTGKPELENWMAPWKNRTSGYISLFPPITQQCSISDVLFTGGWGVSDFSVLKYY